MVDREKVLHGISSCGYCDGIPNVCGVTECPYESDKPWCTHYLAHDAGELIGELLKAQEPRLLTTEDFDKRNDVDWSKALPAWVEYRRDGEWGEYWGDQQDEWAVVRKDTLNAEGLRCWTGYPSQKQREAVKWE